MNRTLPPQSLHSHPLGSMNGPKPATFRTNPQLGRNVVTRNSPRNDVGETASTSSRPSTPEGSRPSTPSRPPTPGRFDSSKMIGILSDDLQNLFNEKGIDASLYADKVEFRDPITKYDSISGYLFNIKFLRWFFRPTFDLIGMRKTGDRELTSRWAMDMTFPLLWKPMLRFTGESVYRFDSEGRCDRHLDVWDSIRGSQAYPSKEGIADLLGQLGRIAKAPEGVYIPPHRLLRRTTVYEVREQPGFRAVKYTSANPLAEREGTRAFGAIRRATQGVKVPGSPSLNWGGRFLALPVAPGEEQATIEATAKAKSEGWPVEIANFSGGLFAVRSFSGFAKPGKVQAELEALRAGLKKDGIQAVEGVDWFLAAYHDDAEMKPWARLNEVWIPLAEPFDAWAWDPTRELRLTLD